MLAVRAPRLGGQAWTAWLAWAGRCRLAPMQAVAQTIRKYLWGILNAIVSGTTNARAEGLNSRIQAIKRWRTVRG